VLNKPIISEVLPFNFGSTSFSNIYFEVKRDDLIHPIISGNKWRKLLYTLPNAIELGKNHIVTFGGAFSNHLPAVALACKEMGLSATAFVRGEELNPESNHVLQYCHSQGMQLHFVSREIYKNKEELYSTYFKDDSKSFFLSEGGFSEMAMLGCANLVDELSSNYDHIFACVGTGATLAGIAWGCQRKQVNTKVHGVVVLKGAENIETDIQQLIPSTNNYILHHRFHEGGYGKTSVGLESFIQEFNAHHSFTIEKIYTGKLFFAVYQLMKEGYFNPEEKILLVHTGGLFYTQLDAK
jgi:1-aminocyclopropane-1-carboxylate deaminase